MKGIKVINSVLREDACREVPVRRHTMHLYRDAEQMVHAASHYIAEGLRRGEGCVIVATSAHWVNMVGRLALDPHVDLVDAVASGQLRHMDAELVLCGLLENGMPNDSLFHERAGTVVEPALHRFGKVRIVNELAGMLWEAGNRPAAIRLEELWNGLAARLPFALMCTYRSDGEGADRYNSPLRCVCDAHSHLVAAPEDRPTRLEANILKQEVPRAAQACRDTA